MRGIEHGWLPRRLTIISTAVSSLTRINPVLLVAGEGALLLVGQ
jgi:hypothetical protein